MEYTEEQELVVKKVLGNKQHSYYDILSVTKSSSEGEIKKSYRKLAVKCHPDKNKHPKAAEAFKYVNKAWEVLGTPEKKRIYDQTGVDPDARGAASSSYARDPFSRAGGRTTFTTMNGGGGGLEEELFNMFFGGQGAQTFTFGGNNGFTFQTFGGGDPFFASNQHFHRARTTRRQNTHAQQNNETNSTFQILSQILPLLLLLLVPLFSAIFGESSPEYSFTPSNQFRNVQFTSNYNIPFYVEPNFHEKNDQQMKQFKEKVEKQFIQEKKVGCSRQRSRKNELIEDAHGWFFTDEVALKKAQNYPTPDCDILKQMNLI